MNTQVNDTPETKDAYQWRDGEGALAHEIRRAKTMEKLERERNEARAMAHDQRNQLENISPARLFFPWES